jgi:hypothetical protein
VHIADHTRSLNPLENLLTVICRSNEAEGKILGDLGLASKFIQSDLIAVVIVLEKFILIVVVESNNRNLGVLKTEHLAAPQIEFVDLLGQSF